jgi:hypothetical protein
MFNNLNIKFKIFYITYISVAGPRNFFWWFLTDSGMYELVKEIEPEWGSFRNGRRGQQPENEGMTKAKNRYGWEPVEDLEDQ